MPNYPSTVDQLTGDDRPLPAINKQNRPYGPDNAAFSQALQGTASASPGTSNRLTSGTERTTGGASYPEATSAFTGSTTTHLSGSDVVTDAAESPSYYFSNSISQEVLANYLDRAIDMQALCNDSFSNSVGEFGRPHWQAVSDFLGPTHDEHAKHLVMLRYLKPKMITYMAGLWDNMWPAYIEIMLVNLKADLEYIHNYIDSDIICAAGAGEHIDYNVDNVIIPRYVWNSFNSPATYTGRKFNYVNMCYTNDDLARLTNYGGEMVTIGSMVIGGYPQILTALNLSEALSAQEVYHNIYGNGYMDVTKTETQMWQYYMATQFMKVGCELFHMGDVYNNMYIDKITGYQSTWNLVSKIRQAATYGVMDDTGELIIARRGVMLIHGAGVDKASDEIFGFVYDPPGSSQPDWTKSLLFDVLRGPLPLSRNSNGHCTDSPINYPKILEQPQTNGYYTQNTLFNRTKGGLHPQGWYCVHSPCLLDFDLTENDSEYGCHVEGSSMSRIYGLDCISWFYLQPVAIRNLIIPYVYYKLKCLDPNCFFAMPGRMSTGISVTPSGVVPGDILWYRAETEYENGEDTISKLWNGYFTNLPYQWINHNWTAENFCGGTSPNAYKNLIFVGDDKIFYVGSDQRVYAFVKFNGSWLGTSPSWWVQAPQTLDGRTIAAVTPVAVEGPLVANPNGTSIIYIGVDGYIHGFSIWSIWQYTYFDFMATEMRSASIKASRSLIFPQSDRVYFISQEAYGDGQINSIIYVGSWRLGYPAGTAVAHGEVIADMMKPAGALTYDINTSRLYYRGDDGLLYYFQSYSIDDYVYVICPANALLNAQHLKIQGNLAIFGNKIYYAGKYLVDNTIHIHCIIDDGSSTWNTVSPSYSADYYNRQPISTQHQADESGEISVSPDGTTIAYSANYFYEVPVSGSHFSAHISELGSKVCYFKTTHLSYVFVYGEMGANPSQSPIPFNSLQFISNTEIFYIDGSESVYKFTFQEDYCNNPIIAEYEGS